MASITKRQTTHWDIREDGQTIRVHFDGKVEFHFEPGDFESWTILGSDPLLLDYEHPWERIFITNEPSNLWTLTNELTAAVSRVSPRPPETYFNEQGMASILEGGYGLLFDGPSPVAEEVSAALQLAGIRIQRLRFPHRNGPMKILRAGQSFVIGKGFREERRAHSL